MALNRFNGQDRILPCTRALFDDNDNFLGVAGVELTFDTIVDTVLQDFGLVLCGRWRFRRSAGE